MFVVMRDYIRAMLGDTRLFSIFPWEDWSAAWLRVLCEATQEACAIHYRMAAVLSSRAVPCALLSRDAFHAGTLRSIAFPVPEVVCLETVSLFSGIKQN